MKLPCRPNHRNDRSSVCWCDSPVKLSYTGLNGLHPNTGNAVRNGPTTALKLSAPPLRTGGKLNGCHADFDFLVIGFTPFDSRNSHETLRRNAAPLFRYASSLPGARPDTPAKPFLPEPILPGGMVLPLYPAIRRC